MTIGLESNLDAIEFGSVETHNVSSVISRFLLVQ